jgi:hypothetical protein
MTKAPVPTIFDSFNARVLNSTDVAKTFVPSQQYFRLMALRHTVVLGPRGSGKTTLLKMLQQPALEVWQHPDADQCRAAIDFTGVFIATDISWGEQIKSLGHGRLDDNSHKLLAVSTFTTHVLRSLVIAMLHRKRGTPPPLYSHRRINISAEHEERLALQLANDWRMDEAVPTLLFLKQSLTRRLSTIREIASREALLGDEGRTQRLASMPFLHLHFLQSCSLAVEYFEDIIGESGKKWALMFDELELAPDWVQDELAASLRSTDDHFLFKLALNPYTPNSYLMKTALSPAPGVWRQLLFPVNDNHNSR